MEKDKLKTAFYIDGYNLYRGIKDCDILYPFYLWLDLGKLCNGLVDKLKENLIAINYFTAYPIGNFPDDEQKKDAHKTYVSALKVSDTRFNPVIGTMAFSEVKCRAKMGCGIVFQRPVEKKSDVSLGVSIVADALNKEIDSFYIVSGDRDVVPALETSRKYRKNDIRITACFPPMRDKDTTEIRSHCDSFSTIEESSIMLCQLPLDIPTKGGGHLYKPRRWDKPPRGTQKP